MSDALRIAGGIALGTLLAALPFLHYRWGHGEHAHAQAPINVNDVFPLMANERGIESIIQGVCKTRSTFSIPLPS